MPPRKRQKQRNHTDPIKWDEQPVVDEGTFDTPFGFRLQTRKCPPTGGKVRRAQIGRLDDNGSWEKLVAKCSVAIGNADNRDVVLETYRKCYDDETMEAAAEAREEEGRAAVAAAVAASDAMGRRDDRAAPTKRDEPVATAQTLHASSVTRRRNTLIASYYRDRGATPLFDRTWGGTVIQERRGGGSAGLLSCVSELGAYHIKQHPLLVRRFAKLMPPIDEVEAADDVVEFVDDDERDVDAVAATPAPVDEASVAEAAALAEDEDEADDASAPIPHAIAANSTNNLWIKLLYPVAGISGVRAWNLLETSPCGHGFIPPLQPLRVLPFNLRIGRPSRTLQPMPRPVRRLAGHAAVGHGTAALA